MRHFSSRICLHEIDAAVIHSHPTCWNRHSAPRLDETPAPWLLTPPKIYQNQLNKESINTSSVFVSKKKKRETEKEQVLFEVVLESCVLIPD